MRIEDADAEKQAAVAAAAATARAEAEEAAQHKVSALTAELADAREAVVIAQVRPLSLTRSGATTIVVSLF